MKRKILLVVSVVLGISILAGCQDNVKTQKETEVNTKINSSAESIPEKAQKNSAVPQEGEQKQTEQSVVQNEEKETTYYISPISGCVVVGKNETADTYSLKTKCEGCGYLGSTLTVHSKSNLKSNFTCNQLNCPLKGKVQYAEAKSVEVQ